jgi:hypothetical protein
LDSTFTFCFRFEADILETHSRWLNICFIKRRAGLNSGCLVAVDNLNRASPSSRQIRDAFQTYAQTIGTLDPIVLHPNLRCNLVHEFEDPEHRFDTIFKVEMRFD